MLTVRNIFFLLFSFYAIIFSAYSTANNSSDGSAEKQNQYLLQKIAQAPQLESEQDQWLQLFEQPGNSQHYFIASKQGKIYQLEQNSPKNTSLLLDLQQSFSKKDIQKLTAFVLHPNFSQRDQDGYGTFYTAHVENHYRNSTKRMLDPSSNTSLPYDAVVTEWQLHPTKQVEILKQREVLKIAIPIIDNGINQLSFNPYSKSWHDDFAQLYISLPESPSLKQFPLHSGVILRINPNKIATAGYGVPHSNPFYANELIESSIYLLGAGKITQFIWPDKYATKLLVSHQYNANKTTRQWLSFSLGGEDWRKKAPTEFIYQDKQPLSANSLLVYRGQNAPALRNKLLMLVPQKSQWQIKSLSREKSTAQTNVKLQPKSLSPPQVEWQLHQKELLAVKLSLFRDNRGELLLFNEDSSAIYQLFQQDVIPGSQEDKQSTLGSITFFFVVMLGLLAGYLFYQINIQHKSAKSLVRREFSTLTLTEDKLALNLFRRHQHEAEKVVAFTDINQCQVFIGNLVITTINTTLGHGFNEQQELALREIFHTEQIDKMVDGKVRRISLVINTSEKNKHIICLYLRKGSDRITKKNYFEVVDDVIDWCWIIANEINSKHTGERSLKPRITAVEIAQAEHKSHDDTPLHKQAAIIRPATHPLTDTSKHTAVDEFNHEQKNKDEPTAQNSHETAKVETDLVNAIDKLGKLQQQGLLSADEFAQAKAKLLSSLNKTE